MSGRRHIFVALAGVALLFGCVTPAPTPSPTAALSPRESTITPRPSTTNGWAFATLDAPVPDIRRVDLGADFLYHRGDADGPMVVLDTSASSSAHLGITLVNLAAETQQVLYTPPADWQSTLPAISGDKVAWVDWQCTDQTCDNESWRVLVSGLTPGTQHALASGTSPAQPLVDLDGNELVYNVPEPQAGAPFASRIHVLDPTTGTTLRSITSELGIYQLAISDGNVAYVEGEVDTSGGFVHHTRLMLWRADATTAVKVADDAFEVSFADGRLAWIRDRESSQLPAGNPLSPQVYSASLDALTPQAVGVDPHSNPIETTEEWPTTAAGLVAWGSEQVNPSVPEAAVGDRLALWNASTGQSVQLDLPHGITFPLLSDTWLVWLDGRPDLYGVEGIPLSALGIN
jgi:hypothetical protein